MPKPAARVTPAKPPPGCDQCRPYVDAAATLAAVAERGAVPDVFMVGVFEDRLREAVASVRRVAGASQGHQSASKTGARRIDPGASNGHQVKPTL
jgi:anti-sigma factor RsiW